LNEEFSAEGRKVAVASGPRGARNCIDRVAGEAQAAIARLDLDHDATTCGINTSVTEALASIETIRSNAARVLMSHNTTLTKYQSSGFPRIEDVRS
jgi:hypothetical protein